MQLMLQWVAILGPYVTCILDNVFGNRYGMANTPFYFGSTSVPALRYDVYLLSASSTNGTLRRLITFRSPTYGEIYDVAVGLDSNPVVVGEFMDTL